MIRRLVLSVDVLKLRLIMLSRDTDIRETNVIFMANKNISTAVVRDVDICGANGAWMFLIVLGRSYLSLIRSRSANFREL
jgi:hypothetical protein